MPILVSNNKKQGQKNRRNPPVFNFGRNPFAPTRKFKPSQIATVLIFCLERTDSNDKILWLCSVDQFCPNQCLYYLM